MNAPLRARRVWLKGGALGDVILALPSLAWLRATDPEAWIGVVAPRRLLPLTHPWGSAFLALEDLGGPPPWPEAESGLDWALAFRARSALPPWILGARSLRLASPLPAPGRHAVDHALAAATEGSAEQGAWPEIPLGSEALAAGAALRARLGKGRPVAVLLPGGGGALKRWGSEGFSVVAEGLRRGGFAPVIALGPVEREEGAEAFWSAHPWPVATDLEVLTLGALLADAALAIGNDSGTSHLAAAVGCPTLVLYGPTDEAVWGVRGPRVRALRAAPCAGACPWLRPGMRGCAVATPPACWAGMTPEVVLEAARGLAEA